MNEIDLFRHGPITPGIFPGADEKVMAILNGKLEPSLVRNMILTGKRYTGEDAASKGMIDAAVKPEDLLPVAIGLAQELAPLAVPENRATLQILKREMNRNTVEKLLKPLSIHVHVDLDTHNVIQLFTKQNQKKSRL